ncbi:hypothetical protein MNBD_GAMMA11-666 [hydrothermal vent metagenome]|uniref:Uncharacterized protein n=1 Tax=hydrothermal vent metagenome TaxID=652676 RepID=A0A3B0X358_9ZZZZ
MIDTEYGAKLKELSSDYYHNHIGFEAYRTKRKHVLDKIDEEYNGRKPVEEVEDEQPSGDTQIRPGESSIFMKTIAFFKNNNTEQ